MECKKRGELELKSVIHGGDIPINCGLLFPPPPPPKKKQQHFNYKQKDSVQTRAIPCDCFFTCAGKFTTEGTIRDNPCRTTSSSVWIFLARIPEVFAAGKIMSATIMQANQYAFYSKFENENLASRSFLTIFFTVPSNGSLLFVHCHFTKSNRHFKELVSDTYFLGGWSFCGISILPSRQERNFSAAKLPVCLHFVAVGRFDFAAQN